MSDQEEGSGKIRATFTMQTTADFLRDTSGLIRGCRIVGTCNGRTMVDTLMWLDRETTSLAVLKPHLAGIPDVG